jgi:tetratricopeptide (TPR) repeat protein
MLNDGLSSEYANISDPGIQLWHNGLSPAEMRHRLPYVQGSTPTTRAENAHELAERIGATVVIYGHLTADMPPRFILEFYQVDPLLRTESVHTLGRYQFGDSLRIDVDLDQTDNRETERLRAQVTQRATTLYRLLRALNQDLLGNPTEALAILNDEEQQLQAWESQWNRVAGGKEILFFFIGRSLLFLDRYEEAEQALDKSLAINSTFPQAQITKGTVYLQAVLDQSIDQIEADDFGQAIDAYRRGKSQAEQADEPLLITLADLALGITLRQQGDTAFVHGIDDRALAAFDEAIPLLEGVQRALDGVPQYRLLGQAYESLGLANYQKALILESRGEIDQPFDLYQAAAVDFERCTQQSDEDRRSDQILLNDIVVRNCWPMRALVHETVGRLALRQAQALNGDEQRRWYGEAEAAFGRCIEQKALLEENLLADALILDPEPLAEISATAERCQQLLAEIQAQLTISSNEAR